MNVFEFLDMFKIQICKSVNDTDNVNWAIIHKCIEGWFELADHRIAFRTYVE